MPVNTTSDGIFAPDIIIRTGIMQGLRELRKMPELLDYVFASLPKDELTAKDYGQATIDKAKKWFLATDIPVTLNLRIGDPQFPIISITILEEVEEANSLGDINPGGAMEESLVTPWNPITSLFSVTSYDISTGYIGLPKTITDSVLVFPGMVIVDGSGVPHTITEAIDENTIAISPAIADFSSAVLKYPQPVNRVDLESAEFNGTFRIGCHAQGEVEILLWMKAIVQFILLRYKQQYFEARGFGRSYQKCSAITSDANWGMDNVYCTYISFSGSYRNYWPKYIGLPIEGTVDRIYIANDGTSPPGTNLSNVNWALDGDRDILDALKNVGIK